MKTRSSTLTRVFVYGSLKRGFHNHRFLHGQRFVGEARTQQVYRLLSLTAYPGMIGASDAGRSVRGEVWEVDATCKLMLDHLEGVDHGHYACVEARLLPPFDQAQVLTYIYARETAGLPDAGDEWNHPSRNGGNLS